MTDFEDDVLRKLAEAEVARQEEMIRLADEIGPEDRKLDDLRTAHFKDRAGVQKALRPLVEMERLRERVRRTVALLEAGPAHFHYTTAIQTAHEDAVELLNPSDPLEDENSGYHCHARLLVAGLWIEGFVEAHNPHFLYLKRTGEDAEIMVPWAQIAAFEARASINHEAVRRSLHDAGLEDGSEATTPSH
ncbi:hypothetical protein [Muricoccus aerilatus]|uniref:hypothetical protein n=1 Tax=Muricoccus aerilatus TaxID=452982 RepID=UPI0005C254D9|nr:hypothetical protein [Roseomonas aerilata]